MNYLTKLSERQTKLVEDQKGRRTSITKTGIEDKIMACNPFLEAFGNAKTTRNDNSSRFGKYTKILYHGGRIMGAVMEDYLLEKARVTAQLDGERNFHIFYFLLKGATGEEKKKYHLMEPQAYRYLNNRYIEVRGVRAYHSLTSLHTQEIRLVLLTDVVECYENSDTNARTQVPHESDDDLFKRFENVSKADVSETMQQAMWRTLSGILLLGNVKFETIKNPKDDYHIRIANHDTVEKAAELLGLDADSLNNLLRKRVIPAIMEGEKDMHKPYETVLEAGDALDALSKEIYARMFKYVVFAVNKTLAPDDDRDEDNFIGILDIFGFEIFVENSFEQLLINYANEMLQNLFNEHVFKNEAKIYEDEGISIEHIEFPDNQPCVELIDGDYKHCKFTGILGQLDELTLRPVTKGRKPPSDRDFGKNLRKVFFDKKGLSKRGKEAKKRFRLVKKLNKFKGRHFWVNHFAGEVDYVTDGFINKNKDKVLPHLLSMMEASKVDYVQDLFLTNWDTGKKRAPPDDKKKKKGKKKRRSKKGGKTIGLKFKNALQSLSRTLRKTQPHYIRCVKPNDHNTTAIRVGKPLRV